MARPYRWYAGIKGSGAERSVARARFVRRTAQADRSEAPRSVVVARVCRAALPQRPPFPADWTYRREACRRKGKGVKVEVNSGSTVGGHESRQSKGVTHRTSPATRRDIPRLLDTTRTARGRRIDPASQSAGYRSVCSGSPQPPRVLARPDTRWMLCEDVIGSMASIPADPSTEEGRLVCVERLDPTYARSNWDVGSARKAIRSEIDRHVMRWRRRCEYE